MVELECPPEIKLRSALIRFEFKNPLASTEGTGLLLSHNSRAGYFRYIETRPGTGSSEFVVTLPDNAHCVGFAIVPWSESGREIIVKRVSIEPFTLQEVTQGARGKFKTFRNVERFDPDVTRHPTLDSFFACDKLPAGLHVIDCAGLPLEILYSPKGARTTSVVFNAALGEATQEIPRFMAGPTFARQESNGIFVFDASLYNDDSLMLAWYAGSKRFRMQEVLPSIIQKFAMHAGGERTLLFGASGGGFAAIYYAQFFPGSIVMAINPQTIIANYIPRIVDAYARLCWGAQSEGAVSEVLQKVVVSDLRSLDLSNADFRLIYLQNSADGHVEEHLIPFCSAHSDNKRIFLIADHWGSGHVSPPQALVAHILTTVIGNSSGWEGILSEEFSALCAPNELQIRSRIEKIESES